MKNSTESIEISKIDDMYAEALIAFQKGDLNGVLNHWNEEGVYLWPAIPPAIGKESIRTAYQKFFDEWSAEETYHKYEIEVSGKLAYRRFSTELKLTPKAGGT